MAPQRTRKRKDTTSTTVSDTNEATPPPTLLPINASSPIRTPARSPTRSKSMKITVAQKQALIDNLQLEITERARRLRAQYALQAQGLRTRLEIRVHRIPPALRTRTIEEVLKEYQERNAALKKSNNVVATQVTCASPTKALEKVAKAIAPVSPAPRGTKRTSTDMDPNAEKENTIVTNPKKRARNAPTPPEKPYAAPARLALSPRSNNSRMLAVSPFKPLPPSPFKSQIARPISPLKPSVAVPTASSLAKTFVAKTSKAKKDGATRPASRQGAVSAASGVASQATRAKRRTPAVTAAQASEQEDGRASSMSDASAGTTIITKSTTTTAPRVAGAAKKPTRVVQGRYTGPGATTTSNTAAPTTTTTTTTATATATKENAKGKGVEKEKKTGLASKIAGMGAKAGRKVAGAAAAATTAKLEATAAMAGGGRVLRKRA